LEVVPFGELARYKKLGETSQERKSLESSWNEGVWLGHARGSSESLVGTKDGVVRAWTIRRIPEEERWGPESITEMQGALARPSALLPGLHIPIAINIDASNAEGIPAEVATRQEEKRARRVYLKAEDFEAHGYTEGCDGCSRQKAGMEARPHTETCRARLEEELAKDNGPRWMKAKAREMARTAADAGLVRARGERETRSAGWKKRQKKRSAEVLP